MITIDLICEACGEANPPGTEFCRNCDEFLAWDRDDPSAPATGAGSSTATTAAVSPTTPTVPLQPVVRADPTVEQTVPLPPVEMPGQPAAQVPVADAVCPYCATVNPPARRFCAHCGYSFVAAYGTDPGVDWSGWTPQALAARDREARKAYRRSLPPLYRWRRVIIAAVAFALFVGLGALIRRDPVALAQDGWYRVNDDYVTVAGVQVQVEPADATAAGSDPGSVVDGTEQEWTMSWAPTGPSTCGAAPGTGTLVFTFPPTRIRRVVVAPGLAKTNAQRQTQPRPATIGLSFDGGPCRSESLVDGDEQQAITIDSRTPVTRLTLGIGTAHDGGASSPQISLTEVWIQTYPSR